MLLLGEQDFAATGHDSFDANAIVMVTLRQATSMRALTTNSDSVIGDRSPCPPVHRCTDFIYRLGNRATAETEDCICADETALCGVGNLQAPERWIPSSHPNTARFLCRQRQRRKPQPRVCGTLMAASRR